MANIKSLINKLIYVGTAKERKNILKYLEDKGCNVERYKEIQEEKNNIIRPTEYN